MTGQNDDSLRNHPMVSVVMPVYNASEYVAEAVSSVLAQTFTDYELIVINDGSPDSDRLESVLKPFQDRIRYIHQDNRGVSSARNAGLNIARGAFYAQLDADDAWTPDYLHYQLEFLQNNPTIDLVYPNADVVTDGSNSTLDFMELCPSHGEATFVSLVRQQCIVMTSVTARMDSINRTGRFDEDLVSTEDFDFWLRFSKFGGRIGYHRRKLVRYRRRENSLSSDRGRMIENLLRVFAKAKEFDLTPDERTAIAEETERGQALLNLIEGKRALFGKDTDNAIKYLSLANNHMKSGKLTLALWALRRSPKMVGWAVNLRQRSFFKSEKAFLSGLD